MKKLYIALIFMIALGGLSAQSYVRKLNYAQKNSSQEKFNKPELNIFAVLVEFQEDKDNTTSGNGKFGTIYSKDYGKNIIDPLPHDKTFFEKHLEFAKNYYGKVSGGKLNINYNIYDEVLTVSKRMRDYSPEPRTKDYKGLTEFSEEVWTALYEKDSTLDLSNYDLFVIFHAGVGNDISVPGSIGGERDIPSVYLSPKTFKQYLGDEFEGFSFGGMKINNTLLLPETESREISNVLGTVLLELSTNGLIVASIGSYLGLPDLFNTETGKSAIGRMGLMDGQAIFAYSGLFPPEPSAWEKIYLGWAKVKELPIGNYMESLKPSTIANIDENTILKVNINSTEYFLIENRQRDALKNGCNITYYLDGNLYYQTFEKDTTGFYSFDTDTVKGVVVNVDEYDWALPGSGILIWHIDEKIINEKYESNTINNDINKKGVDLEEADGIQDIGEEFSTIFGETAIGEGEKNDFWFKENPSEFFKNKFDNNSRPNTKSNSNASSYISISNFSSISNEMTFEIKYENENLQLASINNGFDKSVSLGYYKNSEILVLNSDKSLRIVDVINNNSVTYNDFSEYKPLVFGENIFGTTGNKLNIIDQAGNLSHVDLPGNISSYLVGTLDNKIIIQFADGTLSLGEYVNNDINITASIKFEESKILKAITLENMIIAITGKGAYLLENNLSNVIKSFEIEGFNDAFVTGDKLIIQDSNNLIIIDLNYYTLEKYSNNAEYLTGGNLYNQKNNLILFASDGKLNAVNYNFVSADYYPFSNSYVISGYPLIADLNSDNYYETICYSNNGDLIVVDNKNKDILEGFPISLGDKLKSAPVLFNYNGLTYLSAVSGSKLVTWEIAGQEADISWGEFNSNRKNNSYIKESTEGMEIKEYFPQDKAYNWPNPVYGDITHIRYYVSEDSKVKIRIFDMSGDFVEELNDNAVGGFENETDWNVRLIASGIYFANIEVTSTSGKTSSKNIKIAVIK